MQVPEIIDLKQERIRVLHFTWIAFFISFYLWFNMAPLATTMLKEVGWLTKEHLKILAICNVALTIPARIVVGALIDRFGPRRVFSGLLVFMSFPTFVFAFGNSFAQLLVARLVLGMIGASFVIGIKMVAQWFPPSMIGRAEGLYAGWGNFGSAWAAMTLPWVALTVMHNWFNAGADSWRWALFINGLVSLVYGVAYWFLVNDRPDGKPFQGLAKTQPMEVSNYVDLAQYLVWSFPLFGALMVLTWRISKIQITKADGNLGPFLDNTWVYGLYAVLLLGFVAHVVKTLEVNLPLLKAGVPEEHKYPFLSVAALNTTYFANFGAELAVVSMLPAFFESVYNTTPEFAGLIASSFAFVNLVARPLGGLLSDMLKNRKTVMSIYMLGIALGFLGMANINARMPLLLAVTITVLCSVFVQGAEGATFAILPLIHKRMTGQIAGMAGAYGNVGAVLYLILFTLVDTTTFFYLLAAGAFGSLLFCVLFLTEPKDAFSEHLELDVH